MREDRGYQQDAVTAVIKELSVADRAQVHMAPGSGKTIISLMIKEEMGAALTVMFLPTIQLVHQQYLAWARYADVKFSALAVASGQRSKADEEELKQLKALNVGTTTTKGPIVNFINSVDHGVIFCTYRSAPLLVKAVNASDNPIDLAIFDEAHHVAGANYKIVNALLHDNHVNFGKRLFMTATPRVLNDEADSAFHSGMDDVRLFGEVAYELSFRKAVDRGILVDYQLVAAVVTPKDIADVSLKGNIKHRTALAAIKKAVNEFDLKNGLSYHGTIKRAAKFAQLLGEVMPGTFVDTLNSSHKADHRHKVLESMRAAEKSIVTNVRILGEGFDYSALDFVAFVDPKTSTIDIIQNIGRVMRQHEGKKVGTIILPIVADTDRGDIDWDKSKFASVYSVVKALGLADEMLGALIGITKSTDRPTKKEKKFLSRHIKVAGLGDDTLKAIDNLTEKVIFKILAGSHRRLGEIESEKRMAALVEFCETNQRTPGTKDGEAYQAYLLFVHPHRPPDSFKMAALELKNTYASKKSRACAKAHKTRGGLDNPLVAKELEDLRAYCRDHGTLPKKKIRLGEFLDKRHIKSTDPKLVKELKAIKEKYPTEREKLFEEQYTAFFEFVDQHGRLPRVGTDDEKQLAQWASRVKCKPYLLGNRFVIFNQAYEGVVTTTGRRHKLAS